MQEEKEERGKFYLNIVDDKNGSIVFVLYFLKAPIICINAQHIYRRFWALILTF